MNRQTDGRTDERIAAVRAPVGGGNNRWYNERHADYIGDILRPSSKHYGRLDVSPGQPVWSIVPTTHAVFVSCWRRRRPLRPVHSTRTELNAGLNSVVNGRSEMRLLRTNRALTVLVSLQPIDTKCSRDADARDQWTRRVTGSNRSGRFSFVQFTCREQTFTLQPCFAHTKKASISALCYLHI